MNYLLENADDIQASCTDDQLLEIFRNTKEEALLQAVQRAGLSQRAADPAVQQALHANICTYALTGPRFTAQTTFHCYTWLSGSYSP